MTHDLRQLMLTKPNVLLMDEPTNHMRHGKTIEVTADSGSSTIPYAIRGAPHDASSWAGRPLESSSFSPRRAASQITRDL